MRKTIITKICVFISIVSLIASTTSCSKSDNYNDEPSFFLKTQLSNYGKNKDNESLAAIICYAFNEGNIEVINRYAELFLFPESEDDFKILKDSFNNTFYKMDKSFTEKSVDALYDAVIWLYMYSCVLDFDSLNVKEYTEIATIVEKVFPKCFSLLNTDNAQSDIAISVMKNYIGTDKFPQKFLGVLNLFSVNKDENLTEKIYLYSWEISNKLNILPEKDFYIGVISNGKYYEDIDIKNPMGDGILKKEYSKEELISLVDFFANSETTDYNDIIKILSILPKEYANGSYYSFHYYTKEYTLSFYGSPVHSIAISQTSTGSIIYSKVKLPSTEGNLKWFNNRQSGDGSMIDTKNQ